MYQKNYNISIIYVTITQRFPCLMACCTWGIILKSVSSIRSSNSVKILLLPSIYLSAGKLSPLLEVYPLNMMVLLDTFEFSLKNFLIKLEFFLYFLNTPKIDQVVQVVVIEEIDQYILKDHFLSHV